MSQGDCLSERVTEEYYGKGIERRGKEIFQTLKDQSDKLIIMGTSKGRRSEVQGSEVQGSGLLFVNLH
jgi:hypothetical protein